MAQLGDTVITGNLAVSNCIYGNVTCSTNSTCFGGCTYAQACTNIRNGLTGNTGTVTSIIFQCAGTNKCTVSTTGTINLSANAWNTNATISTTTYPGACCIGTVTSTSGCAYDSALLNGKSSATAGTASTIAVRDSSGYLTAGEFIGNLVGKWAEPPKPANTTTESSFCLYAWCGCNCEKQVAVACSDGLLHQRVWSNSGNSAYKIPFFSKTGAQTGGTCSDLGYFSVDSQDTFTYNPSTNTLTACKFAGCACCAQYLLNSAGTTAYKVWISA